MADSIIIWAVLAGIFVFLLGYIFCTEVVSYTDSVVNTLIDSNLIYSDGITHYNNAEQLFKFTPFAFMIGTAIYMFERAKGTQIPTQTYLAYVSMLLVGTIASLVLILGMDITLINMIGKTFQALPMASMYNNTQFVPILNTVFSDTDFILTVCYYVASTPGYMAIIVFCVWPIILQTDMNIVSIGSQDDDVSNVYSRLQGI